MDYHTSDTCTYIELTGGKVPPVEFCKNGCEDCLYKNKNKVMDNTGKKSGMYGDMRNGVFSAFCQLCGSRCPRYPVDYPHEKKCVICGATLVPWEKRDVR